MSLAWTVDLLSCTFSPNQAVPAHLSTDALAMCCAGQAVTQHTREVDPRSGALVTSTPFVRYWSADFGTLSRVSMVCTPGAFLSTALASTSSEPAALTLSSTLLKLLKLDFALTRAVSKDPETSAVHPSNDHRLAAATAPSGSSKASAYLHESSPASRSRSHLSDLPVSTVPRLQPLDAFPNHPFRGPCLSFCP